MAVDLKLIKQRKFVIAISSLGMAVTSIGVPQAHEAKVLCICLTLYEAIEQFFTACLASLTIEQARKDIVHGQEDISSLRTVFMGIGFTVGSILAAYLTAIKHPEIAFYITFVCFFLQAIQALFLTDNLEKNLFSARKDVYLQQYEDE